MKYVVFKIKSSSYNVGQKSIRHAYLFTASKLNFLTRSLRNSFSTLFIAPGIAIGKNP